MKATQEPRRHQRIVTTGLNDLDQQLPEHGLPTASVLEWISEGPGVRVVSTALQAIRPMLSLPGCLAVIDEDHEFNADVLPALGIPLSRLLLVRPALTSRSSATARLKSASGNTLWALEQSARSKGVRVVLCRLTRVSTTVMRRLQLAVERSGVTVVLIRPASALRQASFADVRVVVSADGVRVANEAPLVAKLHSNSVNQ